MLPPLMNRDPGDETQVRTCDDHGCELGLYDDGDPESGPHPPYWDCPQCRDEQQRPMIHCHLCGTEKKTVSTSTVNAYFDPTEAYHLECGHTVI